MTEWETGTCHFCRTTALPVKAFTAPALTASGGTEDRTHKLCRLCSESAAAEGLWRATDNRHQLMLQTILYTANAIIRELPKMLMEADIKTMMARNYNLPGPGFSQEFVDNLHSAIIKKLASPPSSKPSENTTPS